MDVKSKNAFQVVPQHLLEQVNGGCGKVHDDSEPSQDKNQRGCVLSWFDFIRPRPRPFPIFIKYDE